MEIDFERLSDSFHEPCSNKIAKQMLHEAMLKLEAIMCKFPITKTAKITYGKETMVVPCLGARELKNTNQILLKMLSDDYLPPTNIYELYQHSFFLWEFFCKCKLETIPHHVLVRAYAAHSKILFILAVFPFILESSAARLKQKLPLVKKAHIRRLQVLKAAKKSKGKPVNNVRVMRIHKKLHSQYKKDKEKAKDDPSFKLGLKPYGKTKIREILLETES